jgi:hypothetical protein
MLCQALLLPDVEHEPIPADAAPAPTMLVTSATNDVTLSCANCGAALGTQARFCGACGTVVTHSMPIPQPAATKPATVFAATHVVVPGGRAPTWVVPDTTSQALAGIPSGADVRLLAESNGWAEVESADGWQGWLDRRWLGDLPATGIVVVASVQPPGPPPGGPLPPPVIPGPPPSGPPALKVPAPSPIRRWTQTDRIVAISTLVLFVSLFLSWFSAGNSLFSVTVNGLWHRYMYVTLIVCLAIIGSFAVRAGANTLPAKLSRPHPQILLLATGLNFLLTLISFLTKPLGTSWLFGAYIGLIAAFVAVAPRVVAAIGARVSAKK